MDLYGMSIVWEDVEILLLFSSKTLRISKGKEIRDENGKNRPITYFALISELLKRYNRAHP
jgi:hypothetical protein